VCRAGQGIRGYSFYRRKNKQRCFMRATDGIKRKSIITCPTITTGGPYVLRTQKDNIEYDFGTNNTLARPYNSNGGCQVRRDPGVLGGLEKKAYLCCDEAEDIAQKI